MATWAPEAAFTLDAASSPWFAPQQAGDGEITIGSGGGWGWLDWARIPGLEFLASRPSDNSEAGGNDPNIVAELAARNWRIYDRHEGTGGTYTRGIVDASGRFVGDPQRLDFGNDNQFWTAVLLAAAVVGSAVSSWAAAATGATEASTAAATLDAGAAGLTTTAPAYTVPALETSSLWAVEYGAPLALDSAASLVSAGGAGGLLTAPAVALGIPATAWTVGAAAAAAEVAAPATVVAPLASAAPAYTVPALDASSLWAVEYGAPLALDSAAGLVSAGGAGGLLTAPAVALGATETAWAVGATASLANSGSAAVEWSLNDILKVFDTGTKLYSVTQQGGSGGAAAGFVDSAAAASSQALTLADMANWRSADTQNRLLDQQERNTARLLDQQERNAGRLLDQQERNTTHTLDFTERTAARGFDLARYLSETFGVNTQRTAGQAFDLAGQLADSTIDSNARTTGQVLDAARGLADSQTSFLSNVLSRTFAQQDQTASLVANSYNDAKGRGAQTDTIIMLAIGGAVLVALLALRKG